MWSTIQVLAVTLLLPLTLNAQSNAEKQRAQKVLAKVRAALGGWKIEKYKLNPDLNPKKFEKK